MPESLYVTGLITIGSGLVVALIVVLIQKCFSTMRSNQDRFAKALTDFHESLLPILTELEKKQVLNRFNFKGLVVLMSSVEPAVQKFIPYLRGRTLMHFNTTWTKYKRTYEEYENDDTFAPSLYMPPAIGIENIKIVSDEDRHKRSLEHRGHLLAMLNELIKIAKEH